jgi:radial spoke head protein 4A
LNTANWVHHTPFILPQGKISWEAPKLVKEEKEGEEEEKEEEEEEPEEETPAEPETGPAPLTSISSDEGMILDKFLIAF